MLAHGYDDVDLAVVWKTVSLIHPKNSCQESILTAVFVYSEVRYAPSLACCSGAFGTGATNSTR